MGTKFEDAADQDGRRDGQVNHHQTGIFAIQSAYTRSSDTIKFNRFGEDYYSVLATEERVIFALCDGVGQSFYGYIASKHLAECLVKWLKAKWEKYLLTISTDPAMLAQQVGEELQRLLKEDLVKVVSEHIAGLDLSQIEPPLLREELEERREEFGTQSNLTCGIIEAPRKKDLPNGRILLFWLGDAKLKVFSGDLDITERLNATWNTGERWSSLKGPIGKIHSYGAYLSGPTSIIAHSDGFDAFRSKLSPGLPQETLEMFLQKLMNMPTSDDVSFVEILAQPESLLVLKPLEHKVKLEKQEVDKLPPDIAQMPEQTSPFQASKLPNPVLEPVKSETAVPQSLNRPRQSETKGDKSTLSMSGQPEGEHAARWVHVNLRASGDPTQERDERPGDEGEPEEEGENISVLQMGMHFVYRHRRKILITLIFIVVLILVVNILGWLYDNLLLLWIIRHGKRPF